MNERRELLERYGRFYGEQHFAIVFTETNRADKPGRDPKRVTTPGWQHTQPLAGPNAGVALLTSRGQHLNPAINLRTSNLVGVESDGSDDLARVEEIGLPNTLTEQTSAPSKRHHYFRPPPELETLPKVSFRFEGGKVTAAANNYFVCAPALHPTGAVYFHLPGLGPDEIENAVMPAAIYRDLLKLAAVQASDIPANDEPIEEPGRHEHLRRLSWYMRRHCGASLEAITAALLAENDARCRPPKDARLVTDLAKYTHKHVAPKGRRSE